MNRSGRQQSSETLIAKRAGINMDIKEDAYEDKNKDKNAKIDNFKFGILAFLVAVIIMAGILLGAFYLIVHNNVYGVAETHRKEIQNMPLLRWALPKPPDPEDPEYMTEKEIRNKYIEIKTQRDDLSEQLKETNRVINELKIYKDGYEKVMIEKEEEKSKLEEEKKKIESDRVEIQKFAAEGNKEDFKKYFEAMDKDKAEELYREILLEEKIDADIKKFVQIYENMDETAVAKIFNEMGEEKIELVIEILTKMKKENSSAILTEMDPVFASKVTEKMAVGVLKTK